MTDNLSQGITNVKSIDQIPTDVTKLQQDPQTGLYPTASPAMITRYDGMPLAITEDEYRQRKMQLQQELSNPQIIYNHLAKAEKESQLETKYASSDPLKTFLNRNYYVRKRYRYPEDFSSSLQYTKDMKKLLYTYIAKTQNILKNISISLSKYILILLNIKQWREYKN